MSHSPREPIPDISRPRVFDAPSGYTTIATRQSAGCGSRSHDGTSQVSRRHGCRSTCSHTALSATSLHPPIELQNNGTSPKYVHVQSTRGTITEHGFDLVHYAYAQPSDEKIYEPYKGTPLVVAGTSDDGSRRAYSFATRQALAQPNIQSRSTDAKRSRKRHYCPRVECIVSCSRESDLQRHLRTVHHEQGDMDFRCFVPGCLMRHARKDKVMLHIQQVHPSANIGPLMGAAMISFQVSTQETSNAAANEPNNTVQQYNSAQASTQQNQYGTATDSAKFHTSDSLTNEAHQRLYDNDSGEGPDSGANGTLWPAPIDLDIPAVTPAVKPQISHATNSPIIFGPSPHTNREASVLSALSNFERDFQDRIPKRASSTPPCVLDTHANDSHATVCTGLGRGDDPHVLGINICRPSTAPPLGSGHSPSDGDNAPSTSRPGGNVWKRGSSKTSELNGFNPEKSQDEDNAGPPHDVRRQGKRRKLSTHDDPMLFACIGHHREDPDDDAFSECESTRRQHFSQLEKHHSRHGWFYCARCLKKFDNTDERKVHRDSANCFFKCATTTCPKYGTFPPVKCAHANGYAYDSGEAVWQEFFRIYRPGEIVPNPRVRGDRGVCRSTTSLETPRQDVSSPPVSPLGRDFPLPEARRGRFAAPQPHTPPVIEPFSPTTTRTRVLTTLAELLWHQINTRNPRPSGFVGRLYGLAMEPTRRPTEDVESDHAAPVLEHFVHQLWHVSNREIELTPALYNELQTFARLWIRSTDTTTLQPTLSDIINGLSLARADPGIFDGVGDQALGTFQAESMSSVPTAAVHQQTLGHHSPSYTVQNQDAGSWTSLQNPAIVSQIRQQIPPFELHVSSDVYSQHAVPERNTGTVNIPNLGGTRNSESRSSFENFSTPSTGQRHASYSTNPTSISHPLAYPNDSQNMEKPAPSEPPPNYPLPGPSTRPLSSSSWTNFSQNIGDDNFSLYNWEWDSTFE